jgi:hypothetical protein
LTTITRSFEVQNDVTEGVSRGEIFLKLKNVAEKAKECKDAPSKEMNFIKMF